MSRFSIIPAQAIFDKRLSPRDITVLAAIGTHTDKSGWCFPSQGTLGKMLGISRPMVNRVIKHLQNSGYLQVVQKFNGKSQTVNLMRVLMDRIAPSEFQREVTDPVTSELTPPVTSELTDGVTSGVTPAVTSEVTQTPHLNVPINVIERANARRATQLPPDFSLNDTRTAFARQKGVQDIPGEFEAFRAHHEAHGKAMKNWDAAWRTWCMNYRKFGGQNGQSHKLSAVERVRRRTAELDAAYDAEHQNNERTVAPDG